MPNVYEIITNEILKKLDEGVTPWQNEYFSKNGLPKNLISNKPYQGINTLLLLCQRFTSPYWATFKQISDKGGKIKKGEQHTKVVFWSTIDREDKEGKEKKIPFLRYYKVWNLEQTEEVSIPYYAEIPEKPEPVDLIESCENLISKYKTCPEILHGRKPHYSPTYDQIGMPYIESFVVPECYYSTLFHEMAHSTEHVSRMNRTGFSYEMEELIAEISASFLSAVAGISEKVFSNQISYIDSWGRRSCSDWKNFLKSNPKALVQAASQAQKVSDYIQGITEISKLVEHKKQKEVIPSK
jgi:antirestriction protein ArdC